MSFILQRESDSFDITYPYWIYLFLLSMPTQIVMVLGSWKKDFTMKVHYILPVSFSVHRTHHCSASRLSCFFASTYGRSSQLSATKSQAKGANHITVTKSHKSISKTGSQIQGFQDTIQVGKKLAWNTLHNSQVASLLPLLFIPAPTFSFYT